MEDTNLTERAFDEFEKTKTRRQLLPWWIKVFCWIFMIFGVLAFGCLLLGFTEIKPDLAFYGLETNEPFSIVGITIIAIALFKAYVAFALWFERDDAIVMGKIDAIIGIVLCSTLMFVLPFIQDGYGFTLRLELVLLIPFLLKLNKIKKDW